MIATLTYNLPDENIDFELAVNGSKYYNIIDDVLQHLRDNIKYKDLPEATEKIYEELRELIHDLLREYGTALP